METTRLDYADEDGIMRRVLLPVTATDPREGIPVSVPVDQLYEHMPLSFRKNLMEELWSRGIIEPGDFTKANAFELIRAAWLSVAKKDVLDIQSLAREMSHAHYR